MNVGLYVDVSNLYYCLNQRYDGKKLNYKKYIYYVKSLGTLIHSCAYGSHLNNEAGTFIDHLKSLGFETKFKEPKVFHNKQGIKRKADWDVGITIDLVNDYSRFDRIVIGTADGDLAPTVSWLIDKGISVIILACNISRDLKELIPSASIEIPESMTQLFKENT